MPHLIVEYSPGLEDLVDMPAVLGALHKTLLSLDPFPTAGIRVRAYRADHAIVADGHPDNHFCALTMNVGHGRDTEVLKAAGDTVFAAAQAAFAGPLGKPHFALSLEIRVIDPVLTWKDTPIHGRLSKT